MRVRQSLTALQLANLIADAVLRAKPRPRRTNPNLLSDPPTQAVLRVLYREGYWFMTEDEIDEDGIPVAASARRLRL